MAVRLSKCILVLGVAFFCSLVVFNNLTDYDSNFQFVRHVLQMDTTFPGNRGMWRAINSPAFHHVAYDFVILWESVTAAVAWLGGIIRRVVSHVAIQDMERPGCRLPPRRHPRDHPALRQLSGPRPCLRQPRQSLR